MTSVLFVTDPVPTLDASVDATVGLMVATQRLDAAVWRCGPEDLAVIDGRVVARARRITVRPRRRLGDHRWSAERVWWDEFELAVLDVVDTFDLVQLRIDPPVETRYLHTTYLLDVVEAAGTRVVNRPEGVRAMHEKLVALQWPELGPPTRVSACIHSLRSFVAEVGAAV